MIVVNDIPADAVVQEGDDIHDRAAHVYMGEAEELAVARFIMVISTNNIKYSDFKLTTYLNIIVEKFRFP